MRVNHRMKGVNEGKSWNQRNKQEQINQMKGVNEGKSTKKGK